MDYLGRVTRLLEAIVRDRGAHSLTEIAGGAGLPLATAHRLAQNLTDAGWLVRSRRGYYHAGPRLACLQPMLDKPAIAAGVARPLLERLARQFGCTAHLGMFDQDMVTYLLKVGSLRDELFTKEAMQQEAYCSGLGKVLLAGLRNDRLDSYLEGGPFIRLTENTIVTEDALREEVALTRERGYAIDNREISEAIFCVAVPVRDRDCEVYAALSLSFTNSDLEPAACAPIVRALQQAAERIEACVG